LAFLQHAVVAFFGVTVPVVFAIWADRKQDARTANDTATATRLRRRQLLEALRGNLAANLEVLRGDLAANLEVLRRFGRDVDTNSFALPMVDVALLESTASLKYEILCDIPLCERLDRVRSELTLIQRMVDNLTKADTDGSLRGLHLADATATSGVTLHTLFLYTLALATGTQLRTSIPLCEEVLDAVQQALAAQIGASASASSVSTHTPKTDSPS
jgi:hypothetical protein